MSLVPALRDLLPPGLALAADDPHAAPRGLWPAETAATTRMVPARLAEFAAGRRAARAAMAALGLPGAPVPMGPDRAPVWPGGLTGSIAHDATACVAVVGPRTGWAGLGIDLEPDTPLPTDLAATICLPGEAATATGARAVFCAKEAAYKALYPRIATVLAFHDVAVTRAPDGRFHARLTRDVGAFRAGTGVPGYILRGSGQVAALALWPRGPAA